MWKSTYRLWEEGRNFEFYFRQLLMVGFEAFVVSVDLEAVDIEGEYELESLMFEV